LNRVAGDYWEAFRELVEAWFSAYAADASLEKASDLRARYRSNDRRQHHGAWWELYLYRLLRGLHPGADVLIEQDAGEGVRRPDFCVTRESERFFVEALRSFAWVSEAPGRNPGIEAQVLDWINAVRSNDFRVHVEFLSVGKELPAGRAVQRPLEEWLARLDVDELFAIRAERGIHVLPEFRIRPREGWEILFGPIPMSPELRRPSQRLIGIGPTEGGWVIEEGKLAEALEEKGGRYEVDGCALALEVMPESMTFGYDGAANVLHGSATREFDPAHPEGGEIVRKGGVFARRDLVSAVLFGSGVTPWTLDTAWPSLWENPTPRHRLPDWAFPLAPRLSLANAEEIVATDPGGLIREVLGLPATWPPESFSED
jgi:hypothetical protein